MLSSRIYRNEAGLMEERGCRIEVLRRSSLNKGRLIRLQSDEQLLLNVLADG